MEKTLKITAGFLMFLSSCGVMLSVMDKPLKFIAFTALCNVSVIVASAMFFYQEAPKAKVIPFRKRK